MQIAPINTPLPELQKKILETLQEDPKASYEIISCDSNPSKYGNGYNYKKTR